MKSYEYMRKVLPWVKFENVVGACKYKNVVKKLDFPDMVSLNRALSGCSLAVIQHKGHRVCNFMTYDDEAAVYVTEREGFYALDDEPRQFLQQKIQELILVTDIK